MGKGDKVRQTTVTTTLKCDRCKEVVTELTTLYKQGAHMAGGHEYDALVDLCTPCFLEFGKFMQNPTVIYQNIKVS